MNTIDVIVPCYNPPKGWHIHVAATMVALNDANPSQHYALTLINDGSELSIENEVEYLSQQSFPFEYLSNNKNRGKGSALKKGIHAAKANYLLYTDVDFPYEVSSMAAVVDSLLKSNGDIIVGVRESSYYQSIPSQRSTISRILKWLNGWLLQLAVNDTQAGLKGLSSEGRKLALTVKSNRYLFDLELIKRGSKDNQIKIIPCDVTLRNGVAMSKLNIVVLLQESLDFLRIIFV